MKTLHDNLSDRSNAVANNLLYKIPEGQLRAFEDAIAAGQIELRQASGDDRRMSVVTGKLRGLLRHAPSVVEVLRRLWENTLDMIRGGLIDDYNETREKTTTAFDRGISVLNGIDRLIRSAGGNEFNCEELRRAIREVEQLRESTMANWPVFTDQDLADATDAFDAGECQELADAFAECAGMDRQTFLQKAAERRSGNNS